MNFLYFVPGKPVLGRDDAKTLGLDYIFDGCEVSTSQCDGPSGTSGVVATAGNPIHSAASQEWTETNRGYWIGVWKDQRPTPVELQRKEMLLGQDVVMADGQTWHVPFAYEPADGRWQTRLPCHMRMSPDGHWIAGDVIDQHQEYYTLADLFMRHLSGESLTHAQLGDLASAALATNYRVTKWELSILHTLAVNHPCMVDLGLAAVNWKLFEDIAKKK